jgi:hypothetical protein
MPESTLQLRPAPVARELIEAVEVLREMIDPLRISGIAQAG